MGSGARVRARHGARRRVRRRAAHEALPRRFFTVICSC